MTLSSEQKCGTFAGACFPLEFLVCPDTRTTSRQQMEGFSDSAIFHRFMNLTWTLREPEAIALLSPEEKGLLAEFNAVFDSLPWQPVEGHPHISEVVDQELSKLLPSATLLLKSLERRTRMPI